MHVLAIEVAVPPSIVLYRVGVVVKRTPNSHPVVNKFCRTPSLGHALTLSAHNTNVVARPSVKCIAATSRCSPRARARHVAGASFVLLSVSDGACIFVCKDATTPLQWHMEFPLDKETTTDSERQPVKTRRGKSYSDTVEPLESFTVHMFTTVDRDIQNVTMVTLQILKKKNNRHGYAVCA